MRPQKRYEYAQRYAWIANGSGATRDTLASQVKTDDLGETCIRGVYVVGDASRDVQFAVVAAAEGAKAGVAINKALQKQAGLTVPADPSHA